MTTHLVPFGSGQPSPETKVRPGMVKIRGRLRHLVAALVVAAGGCASVPPPGVPKSTPQHLTAFIVAHPDDWQLFMGDVAAAKSARGDWVVFVYVTAGDADRSVEYWQARERGSLASAYAIANSTPVRQSESSPAQCSSVIARGHSILRCTFCNTVSIFLRLPDGGYDGRGFDEANSQSLEQFATGRIGKLEAVDHSTTYRDWKDLTQTVEVLLSIEQTRLSSESMEVNTHDPDAEVNPGDHSDHSAVGRLVSEITASGGWPVAYYAGYSISSRPANLSIAQASAKMLAFMSYDRQRVIANGLWSAYAEGPASYSSWLFRTYGRTP